MANNKRILFLVLVLFNFSYTQEQSQKCGTTRYIESYVKLKKLQQTLAAAVRPALQKEILTPSGKFRIHYDTTGVNEPAMVTTTGARIFNSHQTFIDTLAQVIDSVWKVEIDLFGFEAPSADGGRGGGNEYDVYVENLDGGLFGETVPEFDLPITTTKPNNQYPSFIRIDNDFGTGYRTKGVAAVKATCAHEFQHAVQVSNSGLWEDDFYFYELSAEAFEPTVFPDVKDYIFDVQTYYRNISDIPLFASQQSGSLGYERAIFGVFLMMQYGTDAMRNVWNEMRSGRPLPSLRQVLTTLSTSVEQEYVEFSKWNFFTGSHADSSKYFKDAGLFPDVRLTSSLNVTEAIQSYQYLAKSFTTNYIKAANFSDSAYLIIANVNYADAENNSQQVFPFEISLTASPDAGFNAVSNSLYARFNVTDRANWAFQGERIITVQSNCFPNPFEPGKSLLTFNASINLSTSTELFVFTSSMDLVYSGSIQITLFSGRQFAAWDGRDNNGNLIPSGIYFYYLAGQNTKIRGKFAVIR